MTRRSVAVCGTRSRYMRGCRCEACTTAQREYQRRYMGSTVTAPVAVTRGAYLRATQRLIDAHPDEFRRLTEDEAAR